MSSLEFGGNLLVSLSFNSLVFFVLPTEAKKMPRNRSLCGGSVARARAGGGSTTVSDELTLLATADRGRY